MTELLQPVFLVDKGLYTVPVYDPDQKAEILVSFGDSESPGITISLLEKNKETIKLRKQFLKDNPDTEDPKTEVYWLRRYVWLSMEPYYYTQEFEGQKLSEPEFPARNAVDPVYQRPVYYNGYGLGGPYYTTYQYPYVSKRYSLGQLAAVGLGAFALGALVF